MKMNKLLSFAAAVVIALGMAGCSGQTAATTAPATQSAAASMPASAAPTAQQSIESAPAPTQSAEDVSIASTAPSDTKKPDSSPAASSKPDNTKTISKTDVDVLGELAVQFIEEYYNARDEQRTPNTGAFMTRNDITETYYMAVKFQSEADKLLGHNSNKLSECHLGDSPKIIEDTGSKVTAEISVYIRHTQAGSGYEQYIYTFEKAGDSYKVTGYARPKNLDGSLLTNYLAQASRYMKDKNISRAEANKLIYEVDIPKELEATKNSVK